MNSNRISLKDYIIIYFIILLVAVFLAGFFIGAKVMDNKLSNIETTKADAVANNFSLQSIESFYDLLFSPARSVNLEAFQLFQQSDNLDVQALKKITEKAQVLNNSLNLYSFESPYLNTSYSQLSKNIELLKNLGENGAEVANNNDLLQETSLLYLKSQQALYREIWGWEQSLNRNPQDIQVESRLDWKEWSEASLHQKNYIISTILVNKSIITFFKPEDITVHVDAYYKANEEAVIQLTDIVIFLINSNAVHENDFSDYKNWYETTSLPNFI